MTHSHTASLRRLSFVSAHPGHARSHINPHASSPDETCINTWHSTNPFAVNFSPQAQRIHKEREIVHTADMLPAILGSAHIAPLEKKREPCRADRQDADKAKLQMLSQGFAETGSTHHDAFYM
ncbi:hypothetical protein GLOTRDRAFT_133027 [Gloeophyllum trabeum ATCC 11539]|uniref:Uncharacterized protein n=1 Tax=Gloeophyllum trabeum (strain ATCC 11539 / FP-39264 / Madison 617) TaxID=670483 RepID=S7PWF1_GLOTA|nr:uncharacterized protein GLOTRDRAFT_133027 [Gloeophyllum trabeum ATCC 11539]EPQ51657.1 hypothetical protein GLOTRDRAFT_133027 [Gloeophyllum trabeum ATCC 11539]